MPPNSATMLLSRRSTELPQAGPQAELDNPDVAAVPGKHVTEAALGHPLVVHFLRI